MEALSGNGVSSIPVKDLEVYKEIRRETEGVGREEGVFEMLRTRWDVRSLDGKNEGEKTEVKLDVEWGFKNPVYAAMGSAVVDKVAGVMVGAFERRVKDVLGDRKSH